MPREAGCTRQWEWATWDGGNHVHVVPLDDMVEHTEDDDATCICIPTTQPHQRDDGSIGWLICHSSLDGREAAEQ